MLRMHAPWERGEERRSSAWSWNGAVRRPRRCAVGFSSQRGRAESRLRGTGKHEWPCFVLCHRRKKNSRVSQLKEEHHRRKEHQRRAENALRYHGHTGGLTWVGVRERDFRNLDTANATCGRRPHTFLVHIPRGTGVATGSADWCSPPNFRGIPVQRSRNPTCRLREILSFVRSSYAFFLSTRAL